MFILVVEGKSVVVVFVCEEMEPYNVDQDDHIQDQCGCIEGNDNNVPYQDAIDNPHDDTKRMDTKHEDGQVLDGSRSHDLHNLRKKGNGCTNSCKTSDYIRCNGKKSHHDRIATICNQYFY